MAKKKMRVDSSSEDDEFMKPHFYKIIGSTLMLKKLRLPSAFTKESGNSLSSHAYIRAPGGPEHRVRLRKQGRYTWFTSGWKDFVDLYSITFEHFLVFKYNGKSCFDVSIYDTSCCEIEYPDFDMSTTDEDDTDWSTEDEDEDGAASQYGC